jgi:quercetin dioxygenase-like cupin family protein
MNELHIVEKGWGYEVIIHNSEKYCAKLLVFKKGGKGSMHYHLLKQETWYVNRGTFLYKWIDGATGDVHEKHLYTSDVITLHPGQAHQLEALEDSEIFETSTQHFDNDSYRIWKGDSQKSSMLT